jgi:hypothetical protein
MKRFLVLLMLIVNCNKERLLAESFFIWEKVYESLTKYSYDIYEIYTHLLKIKNYLDELDDVN